MADFSAYMDIQSEIEALYADELEWNRKALLNMADSGYFSSDRSMEDWNVSGTLLLWPDGRRSGAPATCWFLPLAAVAARRRLREAHRASGLIGSAYLAHCSSGLTAAGHRSPATDIHRLRGLC